ncbi:MAG: SpoVA/SpoVAEb family sporulation membrane protein [Clostridia bacterium]|nr:SpoVA/SpoVAEb family sporulation membrane protein [Clostridia bacterium]
MLYQYLKVFFVGGALCMIGEALILKTKLTTARILVIYITAGVILSAAGVYGPLARFASAGATVPLTGFGHALAQGAISAVQENGLLGAFTGGLSAASGGLAAAVFFGFLAALFFRPKPKDYQK